MKRKVLIITTVTSWKSSERHLKYDTIWPPSIYNKAKQNDQRILKFEDETDLLHPVYAKDRKKPH